MHLKDFFDSQNLNAADLNGGTYVVQIVRVEPKILQDGTKKPALHFAVWKKPLLCNKTNAMTIAQKLGPDINNWVGHSLELFTPIVSGPNGPVPGIRVRDVDPSASQPQPQPQPQVQPQPQPAPQPQGQPLPPAQAVF